MCLRLCVCVCVRARARAAAAAVYGQLDQFKTVIKATDFLFDAHVPTDSSDMTP